MKQNFSTPRLAFSIMEVANATSLGRSKIYDLISEGKLDVVKIGRRTVVTAESLQKLLVPTA